MLKTSFTSNIQLSKSMVIEDKVIEDSSRLNKKLFKFKNLAFLTTNTK